MAAIPVKVTCTADTWVLVAEGVTTGTLKKRNVLPVYLLTSVPNGEAAPANDDLSWLAFEDGNTEILSDSAPVDFYIKAVRKTGEVLAVL